MLLRSLRRTGRALTIRVANTSVATDWSPGSERGRPLVGPSFSSASCAATAVGSIGAGSTFEVTSSKPPPVGAEVSDNPYVRVYNRVGSVYDGPMNKNPTPTFSDRYWELARKGHTSNATRAEQAELRKLSRAEGGTYHQGATT